MLLLVLLLVLVLLVLLVLLPLLLLLLSLLVLVLLLLLLLLLLLVVHVVVMFVRQAGALVMLTLLFTQRALPFWLRSAWSSSLRLDRLCQSRWKSTDGATNEAHLTGIPHIIRQRGQA